MEQFKMVIRRATISRQSVWCHSFVLLTKKQSLPISGVPSPSVSLSSSSSSGTPSPSSSSSLASATPSLSSSESSALENLLGYEANFLFAVRMQNAIFICSNCNLICAAKKWLAQTIVCSQLFKIFQSLSILFSKQ